MGKVLEAVPERIGHSWPPPQGDWTYEDWLQLSDDGWQYEVVKGVLYMVPAPAPSHQRVCRRLMRTMDAFVEKCGLGEVFFAPLDVYLPGQETPVEPDLIFISTERLHFISDRGIEGAPDLVVEVLSPRSWWRDRRVKLPLYEETGVPECWLVDPQNNTIEVYGLRGNSYALLGRWGPGEGARSEILLGFEVEVEVIFAS